MKRFHSVILSLLCCCAAGQAQVAQPVVPSQVNLANLPAMEIGEDDLLSVSVYQSPELSGTVRVDKRGQVYLPMLSNPIKASGLYPKELELRIADALRASQLVVNPTVTVTVAEYQSRTVNVTGAVHHPVSFQAYGNLTLLDALARAEGVSATAGDQILVTRKGQTESASLVQRIPVKDLMSGRAPELNILLHGGEEIRVPEEGRISIVGNVRKPGFYAVRERDEATVMNAVAQSEGLLPYTSKRAYIYRAETPGQAKNEIPVELAKIMDRKTQDIPLEAGDILYIPDNRGRRITLGALDKLLTAGTGTASALVYAGVR